MTILNSKLVLQLEATSALVKFCEEHNVKECGWENVFKCEKEFKKGNIEKAIEFFQKVPLGGNGCFNQWQPSNNCEGERWYTHNVFLALTERWSRLLSLPPEKYSVYEGGRLIKKIYPGLIKN